MRVRTQFISPNIIFPSFSTSTYEREHLTVMLGSITIKNPAKSIKIIAVESYTIHPDYKDPLNDIGLVKVRKTITAIYFKYSCLLRYRLGILRIHFSLLYS